MSIPDSMVNDEIKKSVHYMTYLALSTKTEVNIPKDSKGNGKGLMGKKKANASVQKEEKKKDAVKKKDAIPRKKGSITIVDNILPDPKEAVKLVESISLTEAKLQDEERRLHETYASLVIGRETKEIADIEEIEESEDDEVAPLIRRQTKVIIGREIPKESDEEVLDHSKKLKGVAYVEVLSSDDERTESDKEKAWSKKTESENDDEETTDEEIDNTEKADEKHANEEHADKEMVDEEKADEEKLEDEKADDDQAKDDQAGVQIPMTQKKKHELPKCSSSLTLSSTGYVLQRLLELEKKVKVLSKDDHAEAIEKSIQANVINEVKNQLPKLLPKVVSDSFTEYELKNMLFDKMQKSGSFQEHKKHLDLYNALIGSIGLDEAIAKGEIDPSKKRRRKDSKPSKDKEPDDSSKKGKAPSKTDKYMNATVVVQDAAMETKEQVLNDVLDWAIPERDRCPYDLSKPLPLQGPLGHLTILVDYFFNNDLEYLKIGNKERKYVVLLTKTKAARYELEEMKMDYQRSRQNNINHKEDRQDTARKMDHAEPGRVSW
uniref:Uncharacterized protein n=1 Tax=Tanacetum cinerariifolium TaxID=118510 RepID=A0A699GWU1_TANCI|nr:hypothetical protein [Tanacetum cinerariifolium]